MGWRPGWSSQLLEAPKWTGSWAPRDPEWQGWAGGVIAVDERDSDILSIFLLGFPGAPPEFKGHAGSVRWGVPIVEAQGPLEGQQGAVMLKRISRDGS